MPTTSTLSLTRSGEIARFATHVAVNGGQIRDRSVYSQPSNSWTCPVYIARFKRTCPVYSFFVLSRLFVRLHRRPGMSSIGEVGTAYKDFTIIGPVVNTASRIQGAANAGEILVSRDVYQVVSSDFPKSETRMCQLKGIEEAVAVRVL